MKMRDNERVNLELQLMEPYRGGLLDPEIKECRAAFSRKNKVGPGYDAIWIDKKVRIHAIGLMQTARMRAHDVVAPRYLRAPRKQHDGSDSDEAPQQALAGPSAPSKASSSKCDTAAAGQGGNGVPIVRDTRPKEATSTPSTISGRSTPAASSKKSSVHAAKINKDDEKAESEESLQKRLRRAHKKVTRAMAKVKKAQEEMAALIEEA